MPSKLFIATTPNNYEETSLNYPKDCPQEMGIKVGCWGIEKSGKIEILSIF